MRGACTHLHVRGQIGVDWGDDEFPNLAAHAARALQAGATEGRGPWQVITRNALGSSRPHADACNAGQSRPGARRPTRTNGQWQLDQV
jgi:hypothetical protein